MNCDITREQLIAYFYGEDIHKDERERLGAHVETCPACRQTLEELGVTSRILGTWRDETPDLDLAFAEAQPSFWQNPWPVRFPKRWAAAATLALAAILVIAFFNVEFALREGAFHASIGLRSSDSPERVAVADTSETHPLDAPITLGEWIVHQQNLIDYANHLVRASQNRQRDEVNSALIHLVRELETQRRQDLQRIDRGLWMLHNARGTRYDNPLQQMPFGQKNQPPPIIPTGGNTP